MNKPTTPPQKTTHSKNKTRDIPKKAENLKKKCKLYEQERISFLKMVLENHVDRTNKQKTDLVQVKQNTVIPSLSFVLAVWQ